MERWLNPKQTERLSEVVDQAARSLTAERLARRLNCSTDLLSRIRTGNVKGVCKYFSVHICEGLGVNPSYVTDGQEPKYNI